MIILPLSPTKCKMNQQLVFSELQKMFAVLLTSNKTANNLHFCLARKSRQFKNSQDYSKGQTPNIPPRKTNPTTKKPYLLKNYTSPFMFKR